MRARQLEEAERGRTLAPRSSALLSLLSAGTRPPAARHGEWGYSLNHYSYFNRRQQPPHPQHQASAFLFPVAGTARCLGFLSHEGGAQSVFGRGSGPHGVQAGSAQGQRVAPTRLSIWGTRTWVEAAGPGPPHEAWLLPFLLLRQIFMEHLLCVRHYSRGIEPNKGPWNLGASILLGKQSTVNK